MSTIKLYYRSLPGAPSMTSAAGQLVPVLDACLVNGFGSGTVDSLVVVDNIATVTRAAGHSFEPGITSLIAGATPVELNGEKTVLTTSATTYTFDATGISNQTATGTITHIIAPAGWEIVYTATNKRVYRSLDPSSTGMLLRVDDTFATSARLRGYTSMTDIDTGIGPFPTTGQNANGMYWAKNYDGTGMQWTIVADSRTFYYTIMPRDYDNYIMTYVFGDINSIVPLSDPYACYLSGNITEYGPSNGTNAGTIAWVSYGAEAVEGFFPANHTGLGGSVLGYRGIALPSYGFNNTTARSGYNIAPNMPYPNPADNGLYVTPITLRDVGWRGTLRGFLYCGNRVGESTFNHLSTISGISNMSGRVIKAIRSGGGVLFFDATGPW